MQAVYKNRTTTHSALSCTSNSSANQRPKPSGKKKMFQPTNTPVIRATTLSALITLLLLLLLTYSSAATPPSNCRTPEELVRSSCVHAQYPHLCLRTLSSYSGPANPRSIAQAAVRASLSRARSVSGFLHTRAPGLAHLSKRERAALKDCVEQISDSIYELRRTLRELQHLKLKGETFRWQLSNAETWASAALTNEDTCLDGFDDGVVDGKVKTDVRRRITRVARVTSNALYMINRLDG